MNKGSRVRICGLATLISTASALPLLPETQVLAGNSQSSADSLAPPELNLANLVPQITLTKTTPINVDGDAMLRYIISVENYKEFASSLFQPATYLKPLGEHLNSSRAWIYIKDQDGNPLQTFGTINNKEQLKNLWFAIESGANAPSQVYVDIWDRQTDKHFKSGLLKIENK